MINIQRIKEVAPNIDPEQAVVLARYIKQQLAKNPGKTLTAAGIVTNIELIYEGRMK